jgi:hypothetical protein
MASTVREAITYLIDRRSIALEFTIKDSWVKPIRRHLVEARVFEFVASLPVTFYLLTPSYHGPNQGQNDRAQ